MGKAKINFEIEEESLANAKAFVAKHGGSLNKLVSSLLNVAAADPGLGAAFFACRWQFAWGNGKFPLGHHRCGQARNH